MNLAITQQIISFTNNLINDARLAGAIGGDSIPVTYWDHICLSSVEHPIIDLRSHKEFCLGTIPGAVNVPLFNNFERHFIGMTYKNHGSDNAVALGMHYFKQSYVKFLSKIEMHGPTRTLAIFCWRGGMRSRCVADFLAKLGYKVLLLEGGYKAFRRGAIKRLNELSNHQLLVLNGRTGSGKSEIIRLLPDISLDFESYANHRGSAFGGIGLGASSSQQNFENQLSVAYFKRQDVPRLLIEMENTVGQIRIPEAIRARMMLSPVVIISRDFEDRVAAITKEYASDWDNHRANVFVDRLKLLKSHLESRLIREVEVAAHENDIKYIVRILLVERYDRMYDRSVRRSGAHVVGMFSLSRQLNEAVGFINSYCH